MPNVAFGSKPMRREEAGLGQAKRRGRPASCREGFGGGARGSLTSPSEAHIWAKLGPAGTEAGLPAAERGLGAGPVGL